VTVAAVEAAPVLEGKILTAAPTAASGASAARARRPLPRGAHRRPPAAGAAPRHATPGRQRQARFAQTAAGAGELAGQISRRAPREKIHRGNYQAIVLGEFAAAVLLVALTPVATKKNPSGLSPYAGKDMLQLAAITVTYFLLALLSAGGGELARVSAWVGGLILLTVGLSEAAHIAQVIDLFGIGTTAAQTTSEQGADASA
jgi:hypothetical protein